jgi:hypothetical protein
MIASYLASLLSQDYGLCYPGRVWCCSELRERVCDSGLTCSCRGREECSGDFYLMDGNLWILPELTQTLSYCPDCGAEMVDPDELDS